jgi:tetratricopeptide (TPR) repeat protein
MSERASCFNCPSCGADFDVYWEAREGFTGFEDIHCPFCGTSAGQIPGRLLADARNVDLLKARAEQRRLCDDAEGAEADFNAAIEAAPKRADLYAARSRLWWNRDGFFPNLERDCEKAAALERDNAAYALALGEARYYGGGYAGAAREYARAIALDPKKTEWRQRLSQAEQKAKE